NDSIIFFEAILLLHSIVLIGTFGILISIVNSIKMNQNFRFIRHTPLKNLTGSQLLYFLQSNNFCLHLLTEISRLFGQALFIYLLVNVPTNAFNIVRFIFDERKPSLGIMFTFCIIVSEQIFFIF